MSEARHWAQMGLEEEAFEELAARQPASAVWSLLLEVMERRAARRLPADLLRQWQRDGFTRPAPISQRTLVELDGHLLDTAGGFEAVELSPVAPLGACSVVGLASQNKILSALRGTEVVSDPTNVLALECAGRLREDSGQVVRLATSHRCVRAQALPKQPGFTQHFRMFCLATAGREKRDHAFLVTALLEHVGTLRAALDRLEEHGYGFPHRRITVLATEEREALGDRVARGLSGIEVERKVLEHPYYDGLRFMLWTRSSAGADIPLADGGAFDWLAKLAANRKLVFVASGLGAQLAAGLFRR